MIFSLESKKSEIYFQNKIIILTEELIKKIGLKNKKLFCKILFFLSNYVDKEERCVEIFKNNFLLTNIIENAYNNITDESMSNHLYYLLDNGFLFSDSNCKEIIINNFTSFLIERIKILCEYVIKDQNISRFNKTCQLLSYFIVFLEIEPEKYALSQETPAVRESDLQQLALDAPKHKSLTCISDTACRQSVNLAHLPIAIQFLVS